MKCLVKTAVNIHCNKGKTLSSFDIRYGVQCDMECHSTPFIQDLLQHNKYTVQCNSHRFVTAHSDLLSLTHTHLWWGLQQF